MASTRDHVAAYDYENRRRVTSLVLGVDQAIKDPRRRLNRTLLASTIIGVLAMAGFGVAGLLGGGRGPGVPDSGAVIVEGQGDRFVVIDGVVHPALNLASALLVGGGTLTEVRSDALDGRPRGVPVGIPGVPDALPEQDRLKTGAWTVCVSPSDSKVVPPTVTVLVGLPAPSTGVLDSAGGVVAVERDATWLVTGGRRYRLAGSTRTVLGLQGAENVPVPPEVLDTIPEGPEITVPTVRRGGAPAVRLPIPAARVGDLIRTQASGQPTGYSYVRADGLTQVTELTARLLAAAGGQTFDVDPIALVDAPTSHQPAPGRDGWPDRVPTPAAPQRDQPLCVSTTPDQPPGDAPWTATVSLPAAVPIPAGVTAVSSKDGDLPGAVTKVAVEPGSGALVLASSSAGQDGTYTLVTDSGQRYAISSADAVSRLRYDPRTAVRLPRQFVALLPAGPVLNPDLAAREVLGVPGEGPFSNGP